eukprot:Unigene13258_Nuclearia_a/m.40150 Unigene13258_Nuclearia_a/g.40150  ORF Unigene13258_Nuclearia_a/g.40150 Unigene13258_Nuclearia_a/m.40150 type:complete len:100 (+) Unigene13258_Nuclearia_a:534-833(+)
MERGMYAHILDPMAPSANWRHPLRTSYLDNAKLMPFWRAFMIRMKRNYCYLILAVYLGWLFKLLADDSFMLEFFIPVTLVELAFTAWIVLFYQDQKLDV